MLRGFSRTPFAPRSPINSATATAVEGPPSPAAGGVPPQAAAEAPPPSPPPPPPPPPARKSELPREADPAVVQYEAARAAIFTCALSIDST